LKAYETKAMDLISIVYAESRAKAKHATISSANEAGWELDYSDIQYARRASELDDMLPKHLKPMACYSRECITQSCGKSCGKSCEEGIT